MLNRFKESNVTIRLLYSALVVYALALIGFSLFLRPVGDGYVYGQSNVTFDGVWGSTLMWFNYNNPMFVKELMNSLFVGVPVLYLPWWLSSSFAFMVSMGLVAAVLYKLGLFSKNIQFQATGLLVFVLANISWLIFWLVGSMLGNGFQSAFMGEMLSDNSLVRARMFFEAMDYQVGLMSYVAAPAVAILFLIWLNSYKGLSSWRGYILAIVAGLISAQVSFTTSFTAISLMLLSLLFYKVTVKHYDGFRYSWKHILVMFLTSSLLTFVLLKSPGVVARSVMNTIQESPFEERSWFNENYVPRDWFETAGYVVSHTLMDWLLMFGIWGTLLFLVFSVGVGWVLKSSGYVVNRKLVLGYSVLFYIAGFIFSIFVAASHLKIYNASWHQMTVGFFYMISLLCFGLWLTGVKFENPGVVKMLSVFFAVLLSAAALFSLGSHAVERESLWVKGSVSSGYSSDTNAEWEIFAYNKVIEFRGEEDFRNIREVYVRGLDGPPYPFLWELEKEKAALQK